MTKDNNPAINNSYAVILFNANYDQLSNADVMNTLDESMQILKRCYDADHRKVYHAKVFADQALKYSKKFSESPKAAEYLKSSELWLKRESLRRVGDRRMTSLLREVQGRLRLLH